MTKQKTRVVLSEENSWWIWWRLRVSGRPGGGHGLRLLTDVLLEMAVPACLLACNEDAGCGVLVLRQTKRIIFLFI